MFGNHRCNVTNYRLRDTNGEAFSYKTMKNNKYPCQKYFTQLFGATKNIYVV